MGTNKTALEAILEGIARIERATDGMSFEAFSSDEGAVDAVARNLQDIGESAQAVPSELEGKYPDVPWGNLRGLRTMMKAEPSAEILWQHVQTTLPPLVPALEHVLEAEE